MIIVPITILDNKAVLKAAIDFKLSKFGGKDYLSIQDALDRSGMEKTISGFLVERAVWKLFYSDESLATKINPILGSPDIGPFEVKSSNGEDFFVKKEDCKKHPNRTIIVGKPNSILTCTSCEIYGCITFKEVEDSKPNITTKHGQNEELYVFNVKNLNSINSNPESDFQQFSLWKKLFQEAIDFSNKKIKPSKTVIIKSR